MPRLVLVVAVVVTFCVALGGDFVHDDVLLIRRNPALRELSIGTLFAPLWSGTELGAPAVYWRPLTRLLLGLGYLLGGGSPVVLHALSLAVHGAATLAVFGVLRRIAAERVAFWAALFWAIHPVQVESVAWISAVNGPLALCGGMLSLGALLDGRRGRAAVWLGAALLAKETALAFVPIALVLGLLRRNRSYGAVAAAWLVARVALVGLAPSGPHRVAAGLGEVLVSRFELIGAFAGRLVWPVPASIFPEPAPATDWLAVGAGLVVSTGVVAAAWVAVRRRWRLTGFALACFAFGLIPPIVLVRALGPWPLADRYLDLPGLGFALLFAVCASRLRPLIPSLVAVTFGAASGLATLDWQDSTRLYERAARSAPHSVSAHYMLGQTRLHAALAQPHPDFAAARTELETALGRLVDRDLGLRVWTQTRRVDVELALASCAAPRRALAAVEDLARRHPGHARVAATLGALLAAAGRKGEAQRALERSLAIEPHNAEALFNLGRLAFERGAARRAAELLDRSLRIDPDNAASRRLRQRISARR